ncbi:hypothetical protein D9M70_609220 [compost metagenome]
MKARLLAHHCDLLNQCTAEHQGVTEPLTDHRGLAGTDLRHTGQRGRFQGVPAGHADDGRQSFNALGREQDKGDSSQQDARSRQHTDLAFD